MKDIICVQTLVFYSFRARVAGCCIHSGSYVRRSGQMDGMEPGFNGDTDGMGLGMKCLYI